VVVCNSLEDILLFRLASIELIEDLTQMAQQLWENNSMVLSNRLTRLLRSCRVHMIRGIVYRAIYQKKNGYMASVCRSHTKDTLQIEENLMTETLNWRGTNLLGKRQMH
jgi:hypothetical protein